MDLYLANGRTRGIAALIEKYLAATWFGWAQADPPSWLVAPLAVASVFAVCLAVVGVVVTIRAHGQRTPLRDPAVRRTYLIIVGVEFAGLGVGAGLLAATGLSRWICVWVCAGVGLHFLPLSRALGRLLLVPLGLLVTAVAAAALIVGLTTTVILSTITGVGAGLCLLVASALTLANLTRPIAARGDEARTT